MKVFQVDPEHNEIVRRKCILCARTIRVGQTIVYLPRRMVVYHRSCLGRFLLLSYEQLPVQDDERPGHELFAETREQAAQREFEEYRAKLLTRGQP